MKIKEWGEAVLIVVLLLAVYAIALYYIWRDYEEDIDTTYRSGIQSIHLEYSSVVKGYTNLARFLVEEAVMKESLLTFVAKGWKASTKEERTRYREALYRELSPLYRSFKRYELGRLQFHFPDTSSFLKFERPTEHGELLGEVRDTVYIANLQKRYVSGFEIGGIESGLHFVFPLNHRGEHIGTVEVSVDPSVIVRNLTELFLKPYDFILKKRGFGAVALSGMQKIYHEYRINDQYVLQRIGDNESSIEIVLKDKRHSKLASTISKKLNRGDDFAVSLLSDRGAFLVTFMAIENVRNKTVAYLVSTLEQRYLLDFRKDAIVSFILTTTILIAMIVLALYVISTKSKLRLMAIYDRLTGIYNRHMFLEVFQKELANQSRYQRDLSLVMFDIDHFKSINDTFGHGIGDQVLHGLADLVGNNLRKGDYFARWGGEEFLILLTETDLNSARSVAESLRSKIESHSFSLIRRLTCSFGVTEVNEGEARIDDIIERVDKLLYRAKAGGRNRIVS
jgi:diguanylate cyclase (GGDEF)-like protein